jgi:FkbM family methyltransferase
MNTKDLNNILSPQKISTWEKLLKVPQYVGSYTNWLKCLWLRKQVGRPTGKTATVYFRNGLKMDVRVGTPDISILYEVLTSGAYASTERLIGMAEKPCSIIDLGANIGAFTLRCAIAHPDVRVYAYEPGPQNAWLFERNLELNSHLLDQVHFFQEAATKDTRTAYWHFDERNPGGSRLIVSQQGVAVQTRSFSEIIGRCQYRTNRKH